MDLSQLSDEELRRIAGGSPLASMSDAQLMEIAGPGSQESASSAFAIGAGKQLTRTGQGVQDLYYSATGNEPAKTALTARVADENKHYKSVADAHPWATAFGEAAPFLTLGPVGMAAAGALEHGTPSERVLRAGAGFVGGKLGQYGGELIGRAVQPIRSAVADSAGELFKKYGMEGLPGQITGSAPMQWIEQTLAKLPGGGRIRDIQAAQQTGLNRAATGAMGKVDDEFTPEAVGAAKKAVGPRFDSIPAPVTVNVDTPLAKRLYEVEKDHLKNLSPDQRKIVGTYIDDILAHAENGMPGDVYQKARSRIAARAASVGDSELKGALSGIYKALDRAFDRSAPADVAAAMAKTRQEYTAIKALEGLSNVDGRLSGARAATAGKDAAPGTPLRDVAELGSKMRGLNDSGTAQRLFYQSLLSGGVGGGAGMISGDPTEAAKYAAGTFAGPWLATQFLTRAPVKNYLTKGMMDVSPEMEKILKRLGASGGGLLGLGYAP